MRAGRVSETRPNDIGISLIDRSLIDALKRLWDGPIYGDDLPKIELILRAFVTSKVMVMSRIKNVWEDAEDPTRAPFHYEQAFGDHYLDYEFQDPGMPHIFSKTPISNEEDLVLQSQVNSLYPQVLSVIPPDLVLYGQVMAFMDAWYEGKPLQECIARGEEMEPWTDDEYRVPFDSENNEHTHAIMHMQPLFQARYVVGCARAGMTVYGTAPIYNICDKHVFTKWPGHIFEKIDREFRGLFEEIKSPHMRLYLPPMLSVVLSRSPGRDSIPAVIRALRDEFAEARHGLWQIMSQLWHSKTFAERIEATKLLQASAGLFFGDSSANIYANDLSLGVSVDSADLDHKIIADFRQMITPVNPEPIIKAISFSEKLSTELNHLLKTTSPETLNRHFTNYERNLLGIG